MTEAAKTADNGVELKACAHCGGEATLDRDPPPRPYVIAVWCKRCGISLDEGSTVPDLVDAWNTRTPVSGDTPPSSGALVEALKRAGDWIANGDGNNASEADAVLAVINAALAGENVSEFKGQRPDWERVYNGCAHAPDRDQQLVTVTRETARLAHSALQEINAQDFYHNNGAAQNELNDALNYPQAGRSKT